MVFLIVSTLQAFSSPKKQLSSLSTERYFKLLLYPSVSSWLCKVA